VKDRYGNDLTTTSEAARDAYVAGVDHILAATWGARDAFEAAIEADSDFALAHIGRGRAAMYDGDMAVARASVDRAAELSTGLSPREAAHVAIFRGLLRGAPPKRGMPSAPTSPISRATRLPHSSAPTSSASSACRESPGGGGAAGLHDAASVRLRR
jgi:hypothetical protein